jgi:hypothetical protein
LSVESTDPKWHIEKTRALVDECHPTHVELVYDDDEGGEELEDDAAHTSGAHA